MPANDCVIAHYSVGRLTMSRDDGWITFREESAAVVTRGELRTVGHARGLSAGEHGRSRQTSRTGDSSCHHSWVKKGERGAAEQPTSSACGGADSRCSSQGCQGAAAYQQRGGCLSQRGE